MTILIVVSHVQVSLKCSYFHYYYLIYVIIEGSYITGTGTVATDASQVCQCGVPSTPSHTWSYYGSSLLDDASIPAMYRSDTGQ